MRPIVIFFIISSYILLADTIINQKDSTKENIPLKPNQVLLIDYRTQKPVGIIEVTDKGEMIRLPLPTNKKTPLVQKTKSEKSEEKSTETNHPLIYKKREWNKKQIPYLIQEETIQSH